jgi:hypothetical protein
MKKVLLITGCFVFACLIISCGGQSGKSKANPDSNSKFAAGIKSPVGTYNAVENGNPMQFVLNSNGTGFENYQGIDKRPFTWKSKVDKIFIVYDGEDREWELPIDIDKGTIQYGSLVYEKERK